MKCSNCRMMFDEGHSSPYPNLCFHCGKAFRKGRALGIRLTLKKLHAFVGSLYKERGKDEL